MKTQKGSTGINVLLLITILGFLLASVIIGIGLYQSHYYNTTYATTIIDRATSQTYDISSSITYNGDKITFTYNGVDITLDGNWSVQTTTKK